MAHPRKTNDSHTKNRYATQSVPTDGRTTAGESDPARKPSRGFKERARKWIHTRVPAMAARSGNDSQTAGHCASTRLSIDDPSDAGGSGSFSTGGHSSSSMQNGPDQFMPSGPSQTSDDTARLPASISYPGAGSHTSGVITHPEGVLRSPFIKNVASSNAITVSKVAINSDDTTQYPASISYPDAGSHASGVITHPEEVLRSPFIKNVTATNAIPASKAAVISDDTTRHPASISYPSAGSHASGVITHPEGVLRSPFIKNVTATNAIPASKAAVISDDTTRHPASISYPSAGSHASGVIAQLEGVKRSSFTKGVTASNALPTSEAAVNSDDTARHLASISYPNAGSHVSGVITHPEGVERSPLIENVTTASNAVPASKMAVNSDDATPNIIVFGESGVGKSSLINMITGTDSAATSNEAVGCTFQSTPYDVELKGRKYRLWDTIGLNEGERGTASPERSIKDLQSLVLNLQHEGVHLLVYCIRGSRIRDIIKINYDLFWKIICNEQVPIAVVVTGLENEEDMEEWWTNNREDFAARDMRFYDHACVTTTRGKRMKNGEYMYEAEFELSVQLVRDLIVKRCPKMPWKPDSSQWLTDIVQTMKQMFLQYESQSHGEGYGSHRSQARSGPAISDSLRQHIANMPMAFDRP